MAFAWKAAGLTYNRYLAIAARTVRRSLNPESRVQAERSAESELKFAKWENGKQGELKDLTPKTAEAAAEGSSLGSK